MLQRERTTPELPLVFLDVEKSFSNPFDTAQSFNEFLGVNIGYELVSKISAHHGNPLDFIPRNFPIISSFKHPDIQEISSINDKLKRFSAGHDIIIKQVKHSILQPLAHIFSLSLKTGTVPEDLKVANVIPIFKADDPCCFNNYNTSILPCF